MSSPNESHYIGAAGTKSLIQMIEADLSENPTKKDLLICRHAFSVSTEEKGASLSHNQRIECERDQELEYYKFIESLLARGFSVRTFTQGSAYGNVLISRYTGIKCRPDSTEILANTYSKDPTDKNLEATADLVSALANSPLDEDFVAGVLWGTGMHGEYHGSFLHDVKAYFTACCFDELVNAGILRLTELFIDLKDVTDFERPDTRRVQDYVVDPLRVHDYSVRFNRWLVTPEEHLPVSGVATDPGPGYKHKTGVATHAQDCDDAIMLSLIPHIDRVHVSDETCGFTRTLFTLANFNDKITKILTSPNDSVAAGLNHFGSLPSCISDRDSQGCRELLLRICRAPTIDLNELPRSSCSTLEETDLESVQRVSFCPDLRTCNLICARAAVAIESRNRRTKDAMLSKGFMAPHKYGLIPASFNPNHTVLAGKGAGRSVPETEWEAGEGGKIPWRSNGGFTMIPDRGMSFAGSNGPNIVLAECHRSFTTNRLNLFGLDLSDTFTLLKGLMDFRQKHLEAIFSEWVDHLAAPCFLQDHKVDPTKEPVLDPELHQAYDDTVSLFRTIRAFGKFQESGLGCVCFCQTWARNGSPPGNALFSVMSPHFQVRFVVRDVLRVAAVPGVTDAMLRGYRIMVEYLDSSLESEYSYKAGGQSFVNVDELYTYLQGQAHLFTS